MAVDVGRPGAKPEGDALLVDYVQRYRALVDRLCRMLLTDPADAEDAAQQTFLLAYQSLLAGTRPREPKAWLCTIARRECWARTDRRRRERTAPPSEPVDGLDASERAVLRAELATLTEGLGQLPLRQRQAIVLRELAGLSYTQLAAALDVTESAAEALLVRARRTLRRARLVLLLPFPLVRRLLRHGGAARTTAGALPAKVVAVATLVTVTAAVGGAAMPADRAVERSPAVTAAVTPTIQPPQAKAAPRRAPKAIARRRVTAVPARNVKPPAHTAFAKASVARPEAVASATGVPAARSASTPTRHEPVGPQPASESTAPTTAPRPTPARHPHPAAPAPAPTPTTTPAPPQDPAPTTPTPETVPPATDTTPTDGSGGPQSQSPDPERGTVGGHTPGADPDPPANPDPPGHQHNPPGKK